MPVNEAFRFVRENAAPLHLRDGYVSGTDATRTFHDIAEWSQEPANALVGFCRLKPILLALHYLLLSLFLLGGTAIIISESSVYDAPIVFGLNGTQLGSLAMILLLFLMAFFPTALLIEKRFVKKLQDCRTREAAPAIPQGASCGVLAELGPDGPSDAFMGLSLDRKTERGELREVVGEVLEHHGQVLILLADDLFTYTRAFHISHDQVMLDIGRAEKRSGRLSDERRRFLENSLDEFGSRVQILAWPDALDARYAAVHRRLVTAYSYCRPFREDVLESARIHTQRILEVSSDVQRKRLFLASLNVAATAYLLDEIAMQVRVTEYSRFCHEYYVGPQLPAVTNLYHGDYSSMGLTIQDVIGRETVQRRFRQLPARTS